MPYPTFGGLGGGSGFAVGLADNIFGTSSANIATQPLVLTPAATRAAAETVRNSYATANPAWLTSYDDSPGVGIFLYFIDGADIVSVGQNRIGGQWVDQISTVGIQGRPGSGTDFSTITPNHIPAIGAGPDFVPYDSGLRVLPNTLAAGAPGTVATPGSLQVGVATLRLEDQFEISGGGETLNFHANARDQWFTPVMNQLSASGLARALVIEQSGPVSFVAQPVFDTTITNPDFTFTPTGGGLTAGWEGEVIHQFNVKTPSAQSNVMVNLYLQGQTSPFWSQVIGSLPSGDAVVPLESPLSLYFGQTYRLVVMGTDGNNVQLLGNSAGSIYYAITGRLAKTTYAAQQNDFPWTEQVLTADVAITSSNWQSYKGVRFVNSASTNRTVTVTAAGMPALAGVGFRVTGTGTITFTPADMVDGAASRVFVQGETNSVRYNGATWNVEVRPLPGVNDITAGHRVNVDKTNPRVPVISTPTNTGAVLSANFSVTSANASLMEESTTIFDNASGNLTYAINAIDVPTGWAAWVGHRNTGAAVGTTFTVSITGGTINGAATYVGQANTTVRVVETAASAFTVVMSGTGTGGSGITYTGTTPASQELIIGTGSSSTAQKSGIVLVGGQIPNSSIGVTAVTSTLLLQLDNQAQWENLRFKRIQFLGGGTFVRGINWLPLLGSGSARPWLRVGDWIEVQNIGTGGGNYNCNIQTSNAGQFFSGSWSGSSVNINVGTTVYRITNTGSSTAWQVATIGAGAGGASGDEPIAVEYWQQQSDGTGIITTNDVAIEPGFNIEYRRPVDHTVITNTGLNSFRIVWDDQVGAAQWFKSMTADNSFPAVQFNAADSTMDTAAAFAYLTGTVLQTSYTTGVTIQPDGFNAISQITYVSGTTMRARVTGDVTNYAVGTTVSIQAAVDGLNNGQFAVTAVTDIGLGVTDIDYTNASASADLNAGDGSTTVATSAPLLFWRVQSPVQTGGQWGATLQFGLVSNFSVLAEIDPAWYAPPGSAVTWISQTYPISVMGAGDLHIAGVFTGFKSNPDYQVLGSKDFSQAQVPATFGDSIYFDPVTDDWLVGAPRICDLPVPQITLSSGNQWQVLTYNGTGLSMEFPRFAGVPTSRLDTLQNGDSVRYDSTAQTWYNSRTAGSVFARRNSVNQTVPNLTDVRVSFDTGDSFLAFNSGEVGLTYDSSTNIGRFTNTSGRRVMLSVTYQVPWEVHNSGIRFTWIRINGTTGNRVGYVGTASTGSSDITCCNGAAVFGLDNNQYFEVWCYQSSNGSLSIGNVGGGVDAGYGTRIQIARLNP